MSLVGQVIEILAGEYGNPELLPDGKPLSVLVHTILSHHTSDQNSKRAFDALLAAFSDWGEVATADVEEIAAVVRISGLGGIKAKRIKAALSEIVRKQGELEIDFLNQLSLAEARDWLKQLPGVGTKTAHCVLLFSFGKPALPVDTHIYRVAKRLELIDPKASMEQAHKLLECSVSSDDVYRFHVLMIEHGRKICRARHPLCTECVLRILCSRCD